MGSIQPIHTLNNSITIPTVGFGTWKVSEGGSDIIKTAIEAGYRYFDTASFYGNEEEIGKAFTEISLPRRELFLASKVWKTEMGYDNTLKAFEASLKRLRIDYLDLYLIHWPLPDPAMPPAEWKQLDLDTWRAMEKLYREGKVRAIGVSNFLPHHLVNIIQNCEIMPAVNQLELHPGYMQNEAVRYCKEQGILPQAWSPLGRRRIASLPLLLELAEKYQVSSAQICLRYLLQAGCIVLPKASAIERMKENMKIFDFEIINEDMYRIATLPQAGWSGEHPDYERIQPL